MSISLSDLGGLREQLASNEGPDPIAREKQRRAIVVEQGLRPWSGFTPYGDDPSYYGMNAADWLASESEMMRDISSTTSRYGGNNLNTRSAGVQNLADRISEDYHIPHQEAVKNIQRAFYHDGEGVATSQAVHYGIPAAHADEKMGRAALELSGFDNARQINDGGFAYATDLAGELNGRTMNIDSQKSLRGGNLLQLGVLQNLESQGRVRDIIQDMPARTKVLDALHQMQSNARVMSGDGLMTKDSEGRWVNAAGTEDKLMQSADSRFNPNPSETFQNYEQQLRKDGLLISDRSNFSTPHDVLRHHGPFDSEVAQRMDLLDLEAMRGVLGDMTLGEMDRHGMELVGKPVPQSRRHLQNKVSRRGNQLSDLKLVIPRNTASGIRRYLPRLAGEALQAFTLQ